MALGHTSLALGTMSPNGTPGDLHEYVSIGAGEMYYVEGMYLTTTTTDTSMSSDNDWKPTVSIVTDNRTEAEYTTALLNTRAMPRKANAQENYGSEISTLHTGSFVAMGAYAGEHDAIIVYEDNDAVAKTAVVEYEITARQVI